MSVKKQAVRGIVGFAASAAMSAMLLAGTVRIVPQVKIENVPHNGCEVAFNRASVSSRLASYAKGERPQFRVTATELGKPVTNRAVEVTVEVPADRRKWLETLRYFDTVNFCALYRPGQEVTIGTGFRDTLCNPDGVFAAYHNIPAGVKKTLWLNPVAGHDAGNWHGGRRLYAILGKW